MDRLVVWIVGMAYSGSSLLNLMLDHQPGTRGIGEGWQVYRGGPTGGPCSRCRSSTSQCRFYREYKGGPFYQFHFERYRCEVVVDASKHSEWLLEKPWEKSCRHLVVLLSKAPHEAAWSLLQHARFDDWDSDKRHLTVERCFQTWHDEYRLHLELLERSGRFSPNDLIPVTYRALVERPETTLTQLGKRLGRTIRLLPPGRAFFQSDTHILGGNPSVLAEVAGDDALAFPLPRDRYLGGKYRVSWGGVRPDDEWRKDPQFLRHVEAAYDRWSGPLARLLPRLGQPELRALRGWASGDVWTGECAEASGTNAV